MERSSKGRKLLYLTDSKAWYCGRGHTSRARARESVGDQRLSTRQRTAHKYDQVLLEMLRVGSRPIHYSAKNPGVTVHEEMRPDHALCSSACFGIMIRTTAIWHERNSVSGIWRRTPEIALRNALGARRHRQQFDQRFTVFLFRRRQVTGELYYL